MSRVFLSPHFLLPNNAQLLTTVGRLPVSHAIFFDTVMFYLPRFCQLLHTPKSYFQELITLRDENGLLITVFLGGTHPKLRNLNDMLMMMMAHCYVILSIGG